MTDVKATMQRARQLIQTKQYSQAYELLLSVDHPTADKWMGKIRPFVKARPEQIQDSYWAWILLAILTMPVIGLGILAWQSGRAERDLRNGYTPKGAKALLVVVDVIKWLLIALLVLLVVGAVLVIVF